MKKIYFIICISFLLLFTNNVHATLNNNPFEDLTIPANPQTGLFYDITNNNFTSKGYSFNNYAGIFYALPSIPNYWYGNTGGALVTCDMGLIGNNYYKVTYVFVTDDSNDYVSPNYSGLNSRLGMTNNINSPTTWFNPSSITTGWDSYVLSGLLPIGDNIQTFTIVFKADGSADCLTMAYSSYSRNLSATEVAFVGYKMENMGNQPLTSQEISTIINNSNQQVINNIVNSSQNIVSNQNQNTQAIINNQNQNSSDIIDATRQQIESVIANQNQNTQDTIESQKSCNFIDKNNVVEFDKYLYGNYGAINSGTNVGITDYINVLNSDISVIQNLNSGTSLCFYNVNKSVISCSPLSSFSSGQSITIPDNSYYFRSTINTNNNLPTYKICTNGNQAITDNLNDLNNNITNDNVDASDPLINQLLNDSAFNDSSGLSTIITAPLSLLSNLGQSCTGINLNIPWFNADLTIPCMSTSVYNKFDSGFINVIKAVVNGFLVYRCLVMLYYMVKDFKDPESDKVEVVDL